MNQIELIRQTLRHIVSAEMREKALKALVEVEDHLTSDFLTRGNVKKECPVISTKKSLILWLVCAVFAAVTCFAIVRHEKVKEFDAYYTKYLSEIEPSEGGAK